MQILRFCIRLFATLVITCMVFTRPAYTESATDFQTKFTITTINMAAQTKFSFTMSARGTFYIDWGDGATQTIERTNVTATSYSHTYTTAGVRTIRFGGVATQYNNSNTAAILFQKNTNIAQISGSLGAIFPTIGTGDNATKQPYFRHTFNGCTNLGGTIPETLFDGVTGQPIAWMFGNLFQDCAKLTGEIPEKLFSGISGVPRTGMFSALFSGCTGLTGKIPAKLFAGITGPPAGYMYANTFFDCTGLTGEIPGGLFGRISGAPADWMFRDTFNGCTGLSGQIPSDLFGGTNLAGAPASGMFARTFSGCTNIRGMIPNELFGNISGTPAEYMFKEVFKGCTNLDGYIPPAMFAGITTGVNKTDMMGNMFTGTAIATDCTLYDAQQYTTGFENYFAGRVACECITGYIQDTQSGLCQELCTAGITKMHVGNTWFYVYANKYTPRTLNVWHNNQVCYVKTDTGTQSGALNIATDTDTFHTIN